MMTLNQIGGGASADYYYTWGARWQIENTLVLLTFLKPKVISIYQQIDCSQSSKLEINYTEN